jgi:hypothetical protein
MPEIKEGGLSPQDKNVEPQETMEEFKKRVETESGVSFDTIKAGDQHDILYHIYARRGDLYVIAKGWDVDPATDKEFFDELVLVDLSKSKGK